MSARSQKCSGIIPVGLRSIEDPPSRFAWRFEFSGPNPAAVSVRWDELGDTEWFDVPYVTLDGGFGVPEIDRTLKVEPELWRVAEQT